MIFIAPPFKGFNTYRIDGDTAYFDITNKKGKKEEVIIDIGDLQNLIDLDASWHYMYHNGLWYVKTSVRYTDKNGKRKGKTLNLHRYLTQAGRKTHVDHEDHNPLNNKRNNLRVTTDEKNTKNRKSKNSNNTSGYRNVSEIEGWFCVQLQVNGKNTLLGKFKDRHKAGKFAEEMCEKYYGKFKGKS